MLRDQQLQILAYVLTAGDLPQKRQDLFMLIEPDYYEVAFPDEQVRVTAKSLRAYLSEFGDIPTKKNFKDWTKNDPEYRRYRQSREEGEQEALKNVITLAYKKVESAGYTVHKIKDLLDEIFVKSLYTGLSNHLSGEGMTHREAIDNISQFTERHRRKLDRVINGTEDSVADILDNPIDADQFKDLGGRMTYIPGFRVYTDSMAVIASGPKMAKTRMLVTVDLDAVMKGMDVLVVDMENGLSRRTLRYYQSIVGCPVEWFYSGMWVDRARLEKKGYKIYDPEKSYKKGDKVAIIESQAEFDDTEFKDIWYTTIVLAEIVGPSASVGWDYIELEDDLPKKCVFPMKEMLPKKIKEFNDTHPGNIRVLDLPEATPAKLEAFITEALNDPNNTFFKDKNRRWVSIDWMDIAGGKGEIYKRKADNYSGFSALQAKYNLYIVALDGIKDPWKLKDGVTRAHETETVGLRQTDNWVGALWVVFQTPEEKAKRVYRLESKVDRNDGGSDFIYLRMDFDALSVELLSQHEHKKLCPGYYLKLEQLAESKERKGKKKPPGAITKPVVEWGQALDRL